MRSINPSIRSIMVPALLAAAGLSVPALGAIYTPGNIVVVRVGNTNVGGGGAVVLDEYSTTGVNQGNSLALPTAGPNAFSMADISDHDRHLHLSTDGRYITLAGYGIAPGAADPAATTAPRVVGLVDRNGSVDLSTRLTDAYQPTGTTTITRNAIRSAFTNDGTGIWTAGDNASNTTTTGGLRYTTFGSSTTSNLSRTQTNVGSPQADNVRDLGVYGGQVFDSSGSSSSIGKAVLKVGSGMPTSGSQGISLVTTDGVSTSSFIMLDLNPGIAGADTLYTATDAGVKKYLNNGSAWNLSGFVTTGLNLEQIIAGANPDGSVSLFFANLTNVYSITDASAASSVLSGSASSIISAPNGYTLGGLSFSPVPAPGAAGLLAIAAPMAFRRRRTA